MAIPTLFQITEFDTLYVFYDAGTSLGGSLPKNLIKTVVGRDIAVATLGPGAPEQKGMADLETGSS